MFFVLLFAAHSSNPNHTPVPPYFPPNPHPQMSAPAAAKKFTSFYRLAGMGYLDALSSASTALRKVLKEPMRSEALGRSGFKYREFVFTDGKEGPAFEYNSTPAKAK